MVDQSRSELVEAVKKLPQVVLETRLRNPRGQFEYRFRGALLYDYARSSGLIPDLPGQGLGNYYFLASAADGFSAAVAFAEVLPHFTTKQVLLAHEQNGEPLQRGIRLVVPGDDLGGRSIHGLARLEVKHVAFHQQATRQPSRVLEVSGLVRSHLHLGVEDLGRLPQTEIETPETTGHGHAVAPRRYAGVRLFDLIEHAGPKLDPSVNEDILRKVVVARGTDGYTVVIAAGEIESRFMNGHALVATSRDGQPLDPDEGAFRLVVPFDRQEGRAVKALASVELMQA